MHHIVYRKGKYIVHRVDYGFIVQNILMPGFSHTHVNSRKMAIFLIKLSEHRDLPHDLSRRMLISLLRINDDKEYCKKIQELLDNKKKKQKYVNRSKKECHKKQHQ